MRGRSENSSRPKVVGPAKRGVEVKRQQNSPLSGPIRYFYDQLKQRGASALDAVTITKGLILFGVGATGLHIHEDYAAAKETAKRNQVAKALQAR